MEQTVGAGFTLEELYVREYSGLLALAWMLTGDQATAEDVVHDTFVKARLHWPSLIEAVDQPSLWLRRVLVNHTVSRWRRRSVEQRALRRLQIRPIEAVDMAESTHEVWAAVRTLSARQQQVIALVYGEDRSIAETARILDCHDDTVRTHLRRALPRLAALLREDSRP
jgi:RNA polymerase sigma factor (sigma-70 family)